MIIYRIVHCDTMFRRTHGPAMRQVFRPEQRRGFAGCRNEPQALSASVFETMVERLGELGNNRPATKIPRVGGLSMVASIELFNPAPGLSAWQALLDMPGVLPDRLQGATHVISDLGIALAFDEQRQLHQCGLQGELVLVDSFQGIGEGVFGGRHCLSPFDDARSFDQASAAAQGKLQTKKSPRWGLAGLKGCSLGAGVTISARL